MVRDIFWLLRAGGVLIVMAGGAWTYFSTSSAGDNCRIKGNISQQGERIYHVPGGEWYGATRINILKGERWFCTEADAQAAGWRRSYR